MALKVPIRFKGDESETGLEAERIFDVTNWLILHNRTNNALKIVIARALENQELTVVDWTILNYIASNQAEGCTVTKISETFDMNVPQTTVLIKQLIKRGMVRKKISQKDRRVKFLSCSRQGMKLVYDGDQSMQRAMRYWLFDLSDEEIVKYVAIMKEISQFELPQNIS